jgi:hypothetical protein
MAIRYLSGIDVDQNTLFVDDVNNRVGIGTASPSAKLEVVGEGNGTAKIGSAGFGSNYTGISLNGTLSTGSYNFLSSTSNNNLYINRPTGNNIYFRVDNSDQMVILSSGNVGIGTTSPAVALDVNGAINGGFLTISRAETSAVFTDTRTNIHTTTPSFKVQNTGDTSVTTLSHRLVDLDYAGDAATVTGTYIRFLTGGTERAGLGLTSDKFTITTDVAERLTIDSNGNVGIGTTSPAHTLDVNGKLRVGTVVPQTSADLSVRRNGANIEFGHGNRTSGYYGTIGVQGNNGMPYIALSADCESSVNTFTTRGFKGNVITTDGAGSLMFSQLTTANATGQSLTERMRITAAGNVGIGTTSPSTRLEVLGATGVITIRTTYPTDLSQRGALLWKDATNITGAIDTRYDGTTVDMYFGSLYSSGYNSTTRMVIKGNGNVGIGTTAPGYKLEVEDTIGIKRAGVAATSTIQQTGAGLTVNAPSGYHPLIVQYAGTEFARINNSGNVGIGTTAPSSLLHVSGTNTSILSSIVENTSSASGAYAGYLIKSDYAHSYLPGLLLNSSTNTAYAGADQLMLYQFHSKPISLVTNNIVRLMVSGAGNVGIGTTSPAHRLTINAPNNTIAVGIDFPSAHFDFSANSTSGYNSRFHMDNVGMDIGHDSTARSLNLITADVDRVTILGNGNVGIGTTAPGYKLNVGIGTSPGEKLEIIGGGASVHHKNSTYLATSE